MNKFSIFVVILLKVAAFFAGLFQLIAAGSSIAWFIDDRPVTDIMMILLAAKLLLAAFFFWLYYRFGLLEQRIRNKNTDLPASIQKHSNFNFNFRVADVGAYLAPVGIVLFLIVLAWAFRYQTISGGNGSIYLLNRWTGAVYWVTPYGGITKIDESASLPNYSIPHNPPRPSRDLFQEFDIEPENTR